MGADIGQQTGAEPGLRTGELNKPRSLCIVACACEVDVLLNHKGP